jgi:hypothetical protein
MGFEDGLDVHCGVLDFYSGCLLIFKMGLNEMCRLRYSQNGYTIGKLLL